MLSTAYSRSVLAAGRGAFTMADGSFTTRVTSVEYNRGLAVHSQRTARSRGCVHLPRRQLRAVEKAQQ